MRRGRVRYVVPWMGITFLLAACANSIISLPSPTIAATVVRPGTAAPTSTPDVPVQKNALGGFPFPAGTTWVYSRQEYQQVIGDPTSIITATRLFTDTMVPTQSGPQTASFALERIVSESITPPGWWGSSIVNPGQYWYRIEGNQILSVSRPDGQKGTRVYDFPLVVGKSWCPQQTLPDKLPSCHMSGLRNVQNQTSYTTLIGTFDECYEIVEEYNSGGIREWFCNGIGIVARKYDHAGSRFGFQDMLVYFARGTTLR